MRWEYPASGELIHTATDCDDSCDAPTDTPLWDSDRLSPGDSYEFTFVEPGQYQYYCEFHPFTQRGLIRVLDEAPPTPTATPTQAQPPSATPDGLAGDANCDSLVTSVDSLLILQFVAGLLDALSCGQHADVNGDGTATSVDSALILQFAAGLIPRLPV